MFGDTFKGEVPEGAETEVTETTEETSEPAETAETTETTDEDDTATIIRQNLDADPKLFAKLKLGVKIDGQEGEATLEDLIRSYQIQTAAEKRLEEAKTRSKQIVDEASAKASQVDEQFAVTAKLIERAEAKLVKEIQASDLAKLRQDDPSEWSARMREIDQQRAEITDMKREAISAYQTSKQKAAEEMQNARRAHLQKEHDALLGRRPEWRDETKAKAGKGKLAAFLLENGFTQQEISEASDHRLLLLLDDARAYRELQANTDAAKKKLAKVPKVLKPGTPKPPDQINRERQSALTARLRKTGSIDDAFALLKAQRSK
jgi:hypothetical protein